MTDNGQDTEPQDFFWEEYMLCDSLGRRIIERRICGDIKPCDLPEDFIVFIGLAVVIDPHTNEPEGDVTFPITDATTPAEAFDMWSDAKDEWEVEEFLPGNGTLPLDDNGWTLRRRSGSNN